MILSCPQIIIFFAPEVRWKNFNKEKSFNPQNKQKMSSHLNSPRWLFFLSQHCKIKPKAKSERKKTVKRDVKCEREYIYKNIFLLCKCSVTRRGMTEKRKGRAWMMRVAVSALCRSHSPKVKKVKKSLQVIRAKICFLLFFWLVKEANKSCWNWNLPQKKCETRFDIVFGWLQGMEKKS